MTEMTEQDRRRCLVESIAAYEESGDPNRSVRLQRAVQLSRFGVYSKRVIAAIVGLAPIELRDAFEKTTRTGGAVNPATLQLLLDALEQKERGDMATAREYVLAALDSGTSVTMASRLTGIPEWRLREWIDR